MKNLKYWALIALLGTLTSYAGELNKQISDGGELQDVTWTQRKGKKKIQNKEVESTSFEIKPRAIKRLIAAKKDQIKLPIFINGTRQIWTLKRSNEIAGALGVHYSATNKQLPDSFGAISIYDGKLEGVLNASGKTYSVSTKGVTAEVIDSTNLVNEQSLESDVVEAPNNVEFPSWLKVNPEQPIVTSEAPPPVVNAGFPIKIGIEVDYQMYLTMGKNETNIRTLVETLVNARNAYYANEGIEMAVSGIKIWTTEDPYASYAAGATNTIGGVLYAFAQKAAKTNGAHLMELLTIRPGWGGIAYLNALGNPYFFHSVSSIYTSFVNNPVYNWPLNVVVHEVGHNLGSPHTHNCSWVRDGQANQAIDGCAFPEGSCTRPAVNATFRGTVMSYCHLRGQMDLTLGFGDQPRERIRDAIQKQLAFLGDTGSGPDTIAPIISLTSPTNGATVVGFGARRTISLVADARDNRAMSRVEFQLSGGNIQQATGQSTITIQAASAPYAVTLNTRDYSMNNAQYSLRARAVDAAGNASAWTGNVLFTLNNVPIDTVKPVVTIQTPPEGFNWSSGQYRFLFTATDNVAVSSMVAYYNNKLFGSRTGGTIDTTLNFGDLGTGSVKLDVYANDADGNQGYATRTFTQGAGSDVTKPTVQITSPLANQVVSGAINITANASDNVGVAKVDFYADSTLLGTDTTAPYSAVYATTAANNGARVLKAVATDAAGNVGESTLGVTVSNGVQPFSISAFSVGQDKTVADSTKRNWIDLDLVGLVGTPTFAGKASTSTSFTNKAGGDVVSLGSGKYRVFFWYANTNYDVSTTCGACSPSTTRVQSFKTLP